MPQSPGQSCVAGPALRSWVHALCILGGAINALGYGTLGTGVSHHSGNLVNIAGHICKGNTAELSFLCAIILCFCLGGVLSGFCFHHRHLCKANRYGLMLIFLAAVLFSASFAVQWLGRHLTLLLAFCCGTQNGLFIFVRRTLARSTHMTGYLTDLSFALGEALRGSREGLPHALFYAASILSFCTGALLSFVLQGYLTDPQAGMMRLIAAAYVLCAVLYILIQGRRRSTAQGVNNP